MANPKVSSILEIIHQVKENLLHTFDFQNNYLNEDNPWSSILPATDFVVNITYHNMLQATPVQLVFGKEMILKNPFITNWEDIRIHEQQLI